MTSEEKFNQIEMYLSGTLTEQERAAFEQKLARDQTFRQEVELHRQVAETLKGEKVHQLRRVLETVDKNWKEDQGNKENQFRLLSIRSLIAVAATVLLLVFAYQLFVPESSSSEELFAEYFEPYQMVLTQRSLSADSTMNITLNTAIRNYQDSQFKAAATAFQQLQTQYPENKAFTFYLGLAQLSAGNSDSSINAFSTLLADPTHLFVEQCRWYLALAYLQQGNNGLAATQLQAITSGTFKYEAAQALLEEINNTGAANKE